MYVTHIYLDFINNFYCMYDLSRFKNNIGCMFLSCILEFLDVKKSVSVSRIFINVQNFLCQDQYNLMVNLS